MSRIIDKAVADNKLLLIEVDEWDTYLVDPSEIVVDAETQMFLIATGRMQAFDCDMYTVAKHYKTVEYITIPCAECRIQLLDRPPHWSYVTVEEAKLRARRMRFVRKHKPSNPIRWISKKLIKLYRSIGKK